MSIAQATRVRVAYGAEVTHGTTPANLNLKQLRAVSRDIDAEKGTLSSAEMYPDRQRRDVRHGFVQTVGAFNYELSCAQQSAGALTGVGMDDMLESLLGGTWSAVQVGTLKVGTNLKTYSFERQYLDLGLYEAFGGCIPSDMTIDFKPASIIGGTLNVIGMNYATPGSVSIQGTGAFTAPTTAPPLDTFLGAITEGGTTIAVATQVSLSIKSGRVLTPVIGSKFSPDVFDGQCIVSGTISAMFQDFTLLNKFLNETVSSMVITCNEVGTSRFMKFTLPAIKYTGNKRPIPPQGPVVMNAPFEALFDSVSGTTIQIDRSL